MIGKNSKGIVLLAMVGVLLAASGCSSGVRVGKLQTGSETVELGDATTARVEIDMGAGELDLTGGAAELLEADFTYNVAELKPEVDYSGGTLTVRTPKVDTGIASLFDLADYRYEWNLRLNDDVPMELRVNVGAGQTDLKLGSLSLTRLDVAGGAGEILVDLSGSASLTRLDIAVGAGALTVDLTGAWQKNLEATIGGGVGKRILILPRDTGVRVKVEVGVGGVDATGMTKEGDYYTNDAYGQSEVTLYLEMAGGVGETELRLGE
ncbi:MAG: toast rack family protein [Anaerolineae bacterium]|jgi:hypothetical protein